MTATKPTRELKVTTPSDTELVLTRWFDAPRELVWRAYTEAEHLEAWMLGPEGWTMKVLELDLRPGGRWHYRWSRADGSRMEMTGEFREIVAPERLVHTEQWGEPWAETLNVNVLTEHEGGTLLVSTMHFPSKEERDKAAETGMADGAGRSFDLMDELLASLR